MTQTRVTLLPSLAIVAAHGRDARAFLQGQFTNDLLGLERHPGMLAGACNRQGRVLATLRLAADGDSVLLLLRRELVKPLLDHLSPFVLRSDVAFEDHSATQSVMGLLDALPDPRWSQAGAAASGFSVLVASPRRVLLAGSLPALDSALRAIPRTDPADWERASIADGEPAIHSGTAMRWLPQMLNLDLVSGISFTKGCYLGQEIVARAQHLGRIKRRMLRYAGPPGIALHAGQPLFCGQEAVAGIVTATGDAAATHCLAVVELERCGDLLGAVAGGSEFVPAELPYAIPPPASDPGD